MLDGDLSFVKLHAGYAVANCNSRVLEITSTLFALIHQNYPFDFGIISLNLARDMARNIRKLSNALVDNSIKH